MNFNDLKTGCVAENAKYIDVEKLKALLEHKTDVVDALCHKIVDAKADIYDYIRIINALDHERAKGCIELIKVTIMDLEGKCEYKNS